MLPKVLDVRNSSQVTRVLSNDIHFMISNLDFSQPRIGTGHFCVIKIIPAGQSFLGWGARFRHVFRIKVCLSEHGGSIRETKSDTVRAHPLFTMFFRVYSGNWIKIG